MPEVSRGLSVGRPERLLSSLRDIKGIVMPMAKKIAYVVVVPWPESVCDDCLFGSATEGEVAIFFFWEAPFRIPTDLIPVFWHNKPNRPTTAKNRTSIALQEVIISRP